MNTKAALQAKIAAFLEKRTPAGDGGGWATVRPEEVEELHAIMAAIVALKYQGDADGDLPINWVLIDRTRFEPLHFAPVPYHHKATTAEEREEVFDATLFNLQIASDRVYTTLKIRAHRRREEKAKLGKKAAP
jgi:hypothetical protein